MTPLYVGFCIRLILSGVIYITIARNPFSDYTLYSYYLYKYVLFVTKMIILKAIL